ncbi:MAG TPA: hypothetical protein VF214_07575 [Edaphobacter sp.]
MSHMTCAEFQQQLPDLFATRDHLIAEDSPRHRHLESCGTCSALVRDLEYIAEQAALLLKPVEEEPSDKVWKKIQESIEVERGSSTKGDTLSSVTVSAKPQLNPVKV